MPVHNAEFGVSSANDIADCVQKMRFPKTGLPINEEWVVVFCGVIGNGNGSSMRKFVGRAYNKMFECIFFIGRKSNRFSGFFWRHGKFSVNNGQRNGFAEQFG